jgi:glycogen operon protein
MAIDWFNVKGGSQRPEHWLDGNPLALKIGRDDLAEIEGVWSEILILFNPVDADMTFKLPKTSGGDWRLALTTVDPDGHGDIVAEGHDLTLAPRSLALLYRV